MFVKMLYVILSFHKIESGIDKCIMYTHKYFKNPKTVTVCAFLLGAHTGSGVSAITSHLTGH